MSFIVHVDSETGFSGGEVQVFLLIEALAAQGLENALVCPPGSRAEAEAKARSIPTFDARMRNDLDILSVLRLARWLRQSGADLVHLHTGRATWLGGLAAKLAGKPAITTRRMDRRVSRGMRTNLIYKHLVQAAVAIAPAVRDCLVLGGVAETSIQVIWDAVDPHAFEPGRSRASVREELGLDQSEFVVMSMAALVQRKGIDVLIDATARLREHGVPIHTLIAGEGEERGKLEEQVARLGLDSHVTFLGWRSDKADLLAAADAFVLPSRREGVGVAALEAMAASKPVVASNVGGLSQAVLDGVTGLLVEPDQAEKLAEAVERLARDPQLCAKLASGGRKRVLELFSVESQAAKYIEVYNSVLNQKVTE